MESNHIKMAESKQTYNPYHLNSYGSNLGMQNTNLRHDSAPGSQGIGEMASEINIAAEEKRSVSPNVFKNDAQRIYS